MMQHIKRVVTRHTRFPKVYARRALHQACTVHTQNTPEVPLTESNGTDATETVHPVAILDAVTPEPVKIDFGMIARAHGAIRNHVRLSSCYRSHLLSEMLGCDLYLKAELQQTTGSFKERGALNALLHLTSEEQSRGVIAASAGNHGLALAWHGIKLGIPTTIVMPQFAPLSKVEKCRLYGAEVILQGQNIEEAKQCIAENASWKDMTYINGYDNPHVIAGAGTIGIEMDEQVPGKIDAVVIPCGGGGLLAGIGLAMKTLNPKCKVYAVEPENCASFRAALEAGKPVRAPTTSTLADGLAVPTVGINAFATAREFTDRTVTVSERMIALAVLRCAETEKLTVEGGGATGLAALLPGGALHKEVAGKTVVVPLCGGNIDIPVFGRVIERGLAADGRLVRVTANVSDRPGGIHELTSVFAELGASIKDVYHERAWLHSQVDRVHVTCVLEVFSADHGQLVRKRLEEKYEIEWGDTL